MLKPLERILQHIFNPFAIEADSEAIGEDVETIGADVEAIGADLAAIGNSLKPWAQMVKLLEHILKP